MRRYLRPLIVVFFSVTCLMVTWRFVAGPSVASFVASVPLRAVTVHNLQVSLPDWAEDYRLRLTHIDRFDDATGEIAVGLRDMDKPFDDQTEDSRVVYLWWDVQPFTIEEMIEDLGTSKADQINRRPQTIHGFPTERVDIESPQNYAASASVFRCGDTNFALGTAIGFREKRDIFLHERIVETLSCSKNG